MRNLGFVLVLSACTPDHAQYGAWSDEKEEERGFIASFFEKLVDGVLDLASTEREVEEWVPMEDPPVGEYPEVDALFETLGLVEVVVDDEDWSMDGAIAAEFVSPDPKLDPICYFTQPVNHEPAPETLFMSEFYGFRSMSGLVDTERVIYYVNGIKTDSDRHCDTLQTIADATCGVVVGVYNETETPFKDMMQTAWDRFTLELHDSLLGGALAKLTKLHDNPAAKTLMHVIVQKTRLGQPVEIWAHSQGGASTALALSWAVPILEEEGLPVDGIKVVTLGSAAPMWPDLWPDGPTYEHYVHKNDLTPSLLGVGPWGSWVTIGGNKRAGEGARVVNFDGAFLPDDPDATQFRFFQEDEPAVHISDLSAERYHNPRDIYVRAYVQDHGLCETLPEDAEPVEEYWEFSEWANQSDTEQDTADTGL